MAEKDEKRTLTGDVKNFFTNKIKGNKSVGYDSIFIPNLSTVTFGQMSKKRKITMDHRYIAFKKLKKKFKAL